MLVLTQALSWKYIPGMLVIRAYVGVSGGVGRSVMALAVTLKE